MPTRQDVIDALRLAVEQAPNKDKRQVLDAGLARLAETHASDPVELAQVMAVYHRTKPAFDAALKGAPKLGHSPDYTETAKSAVHVEHDLSATTTAKFNRLNDPLTNEDDEVAERLAQGQPESTTGPIEGLEPGETTSTTEFGDDTVSTPEPAQDVVEEHFDHVHQEDLDEQAAIQVFDDPEVETRKQRKARLAKEAAEDLT